MTNSTNTSRRNPPLDPLDTRRMTVPSTTALQRRILAASRNLRQAADTVNNDDRGIGRSIGLYFRKWGALQPLAMGAVAGVAALAVGSVIWLSQPGSSTVTLANQPLAVQSVEQDMDDLAWEDLLLMQDELDFANL